MARSINIKELSMLLNNKDNLTLLDVRRKTDYEASPQKITGAVWQDPEKIDSWINRLTAKKLTVVYCVKGRAVSQSVTDQLQKNNIETAFLEGGLKAWIENEGPIE